MQRVKRESQPNFKRRSAQVIAEWMSIKRFIPGLNSTAR